MPVPDPCSVMTEGGLFTVVAPNWAGWQAALERAGPGGQVDLQHLLEECLLTCTRTEDGRTVSRTELQVLSPADGDRLLTAALEAVEWQRQSLQVHVQEEPGSVEVRAAAIRLRLRPWTFGQRNEALRRALRLVDGRVTFNLTTYELLMIARCVTTAVSRGVGERVDPTEWPVPLGEVVMRELDRLNGLENQYAETLAACVEAGQDHPDLALFHLCRTFGWTPEQAERLDARTGERMLAALQLMQRTAGPPLEPVAHTGEGVTRIVVRDD